MNEIDKGVLIAQAAYCELEDLHPRDIQRLEELDDELVDDILNF